MAIFDQILHMLKLEVILASGRGEVVSVPQNALVAEVKLRAQESLGQGHHWGLQMVELLLVVSHVEWSLHHRF